MDSLVLSSSRIDSRLPYSSIPLESPVNVHDGPGAPKGVGRPRVRNPSIRRRGLCPGYRFLEWEDRWCWIRAPRPIRPRPSGLTAIRPFWRGLGFSAAKPCPACTRFNVGNGRVDGGLLASDAPRELRVVAVSFFDRFVGCRHLCPVPLGRGGVGGRVFGFPS